MHRTNPYNAVPCVLPGSPEVKYLPCLIILFALVPSMAQAAPLAGAADEVRERLRPFGQLCRTAEACPTPPDQSMLATENPKWTVVDFDDDRGEPSSEQGARSPWATTNIRWPETSASMIVSSGSLSTLQFTDLNLAEGESSRYGHWRNHWITLGVGERQQDFRVREPAGGRNILLLGRGPTQFVAQALQENAGDTLMLRMHYQGTGQVVFPLPLDGAKQALQSIGIIRAADGDATEAGTPDITDGEVPVATPAVETAAASAMAATAAAAERSGQEIYETRCFACHATGVTEAPLFGSLEQWQPLIDKGMDTLVATSLTGLNLMPPMGTCISCTEGEMRAAIQHMIDSAQ